MNCCRCNSQIKICIHPATSTSAVQSCGCPWPIPNKPLKRMPPSIIPQLIFNTNFRIVCPHRDKVDAPGHPSPTHLWTLLTPNKFKHSCFNNNKQNNKHIFSSHKLKLLIDSCNKTNKTKHSLFEQRQPNKSKLSSIEAPRTKTKCICIRLRPFSSSPA